jgi:hypothetical protein
MDDLDSELFNQLDFDLTEKQSQKNNWPNKKLKTNGLKPYAVKTATIVIVVHAVFSDINNWRIHSLCYFRGHTVYLVDKMNSRHLERTQKLLFFGNLQ